MVQQTSSIEEQLRRIWEAEINLVQRLQRDFVASDEIPKEGSTQTIADLSARLAELSSLGRTASGLQDTWHKQGKSLTAELRQMKEKKRKVLVDAIAWIRTAAQRIETEKKNVLDQLSEVNRAQAGYNGYSQRS